MAFKKYLILFLLSFTIQKNLKSFLEDDFAVKLDPVYDKSKAIKDSGSKTFDDSIQGRTVVDQMGFGWNLGNTFDAYDEKFLPNQGLDSEECWGNPKTTEAIIDGLVKKGFKSIRVPVTWHNHLIDNKYTVDPEWTSRVKTVVDMCLSKGLYVILNTHHDQADNGVSYGKGYYPNRNNREESERYLLNIWSQITLAFNNGYDHHLIFEPLNEPRLRGDTHEWWYAAGDGNCEEGIQVVNEFNKLIHTVIRTSGGNNAKRFILYTSCAASHGYVTSNGFSIPDDSQYNPSAKRSLVSVHMYSPYDFAMNPDMSKVNFNDAYRNELDQSFRVLHDKFVSQGYYVIVGEMGCINKNNLDQRINWAKYFVEQGRKQGCASMVWDNGNWDNKKSAEETFGLYHRSQGTWEPEDLVNAYISASKASLG